MWKLKAGRNKIWFNEYVGKEHLEVSVALLWIKIFFFYLAIGLERLLPQHNRNCWILWVAISLPNCTIFLAQHISAATLYFCV